MGFEIPSPSDVEAWGPWLTMHWNDGFWPQFFIVIVGFAIAVIIAHVLKTALVSIGMLRVVTVLIGISKRVQIEKRTVSTRRPLWWIRTRMAFASSFGVFAGYVFLLMVIPNSEMSAADWVIFPVGFLSIIALLILDFRQLRNDGRTVSKMFWPKFGPPPISGLDKIQLSNLTDTLKDAYIELSIARNRLQVARANPRRKQFRPELNRVAVANGTVRQEAQRLENLASEVLGKQSIEVKMLIGELDRESLSIKRRGQMSDQEIETSINALTAAWYERLFS